MNPIRNVERSMGPGGPEAALMPRRTRISALRSQPHNYPQRRKTSMRLGAFQEGAAARGRIFTSGYPVEAAMITDFRTLAHGETIRDAGNLLLATSQHDFPVIHGGQVVGLLSRSALLRAMMAEGPQAYVAGAMDREFRRFTPGDPLSQALPLVSPSGSCALVMDGDKLVGMLTSENLSEFILLRQATAAQAKSQPQE